MSEMIEWDFLFVTLGALDPFRARADQTHIAPQNIEELRQLIEAQLAQPATDSRYARIIFARVNIVALRSVRYRHGAKLIDGKNIPFPSNTRLPEEGRPAIDQPD